jgi:hypothetical protein
MDPSIIILAAYTGKRLFKTGARSIKRSELASRVSLPVGLFEQVSLG